MNSFGKLFRITIFGESHGPCVGVLVDGCPAGLPLAPSDFASDLERRMSGPAGTTARREADITARIEAGITSRREADVPSIASGVFEGRTTGAPLAILFENRDVDSKAYESFRKSPRPGQADFVAFRKYGGFNDFRGGGAFSGRLTAGLVTAGVIAKRLIHPILVEAALVEAGGSADTEKAVREALGDSDSIGGIVECRAGGVPVGLGEPFFDSAESLLSHILFSIPGVKGVEFGAGFAGSRMRGSAYNDIIVSADGKTETNNAGGINGGITNGNELFFRVALRPTASIARIQPTIDLGTGKQAEVVAAGRHDACFALRVPVIAEAACAVVLADLMLLEERIPRVLG